MRDLVEIAAVVFFAGAFWQRTGALIDTMKEIKGSLDGVTLRVNDHGERIGRIEGKLGD